MANLARQTTRSSPRPGQLSVPSPLAPPSNASNNARSVGPASPADSSTDANQAARARLSAISHGICSMGTTLGLSLPKNVVHPFGYYIVVSSPFPLISDIQSDRRVAFVEENIQIFSEYLLLVYNAAPELFYPELERLAVNNAQLLDYMDRTKRTLIGRENERKTLMQFIAKTLYRENQEEPTTRILPAVLLKNMSTFIEQDWDNLRAIYVSVVQSKRAAIQPPEMANYDVWPICLKLCDLMLRVQSCRFHENTSFVGLGTAHLRDELAESHNLRDRLLGLLAEAQVWIPDMRERIRQLESTANTDLDALGRLCEKDSNGQTIVSSLEAMVDTLVHQIEGLQAKSVAQEAEIAQLKKEREAHRSEIAELRRRETEGMGNTASMHIWMELMDEWRLKQSQADKERDANIAFLLETRPKSNAFSPPTS